MNHSLTRLCGIASLAVLTLAGVATASRAQGAPLTFGAPLALIDNSGNVNMIATGKTTPTPLTQDANFVVLGSGFAHNYARPRWSPDGTKLAFTDMVTHNLFVSTNGGAPKPIATNLADDYPVAWLPDNNALAYAVNTQVNNGTQTTFNLVQVAVDGSSLHTIGSFSVQGGCGGGGADAGGTLTGIETGYANNAKSLTYTAYGYLLSTSCLGDGLVMINSSGQTVWTMPGLARVAVSPDGKTALSILYDSKQGTTTNLVLVDLSNGQYTGINGSANVDQVGWSADGQFLFYSSISSGQVTLWKLPVQGGQPVSLFADHGRAIGVITTSPDSQAVVFSYISDGATPHTSILAVPTNSATTNLTTASVVAQTGGQPRFAFPIGVATPNLPTTVPACVVNAVWQYHYTVAPGDALSAIAQRAGISTDTLAQGNCLANPNAIYAGEVLVVPNPIAAKPTAIPVGGVRRITFLPGEISGAVTGQIGAYQIDRLVIRLLAGQTITVQTVFSTGNAILVVYGADGTMLQAASANSPSFSGVVPSNQDYFINVQDVSGSGTSYSLSVATIAITKTTALPPPVKSGIKRISFVAGGTGGVVQSVAPANDADHWVIGVQAGQTLSIALSLSNTQAVLIVYGVDGTVLQTDHAGSASFNGAVPSTQDYLIDVRNVAGVDEAYTMTVAIPPLVQPTAPPPKAGGVKRISFGLGGTSGVVQGLVPANDIEHWAIRVQAGQTLTIALSVSNAQAVLIVYGVDGTVLQTDHVGSASFSGVVPSTQDYLIDVRNVTGTNQAYTMTVTVPPM